MKILDLIEDFDDPRTFWKVKYSLSTIVFGTICGILSGAESWRDIHDYCSIKFDWISQYVDFTNGVPSEWTFRRVFTLLDPSFLEQLLRTHAAEIVAKNQKSDQIAIDGKALRGSQRQGTKSLHSVSAWCHENGLVLGEEQVDGKSNEITAIPRLIESLALKGATITIDAAGCQKSIACLIREKKGHYVLGLKRNHPKLYDAVKSYIQKKGDQKTHCLSDYFDEFHGRTVRRRYFGYDICCLPEVKGWCDAQSIVAVETISSRKNDPKHRVTANWRYYLSSHKATQKSLPDYVRHHWSIENKMHWVLDVQFKEDDDQKSERKSVRSFSLLRRIALNIVRDRDKTPKRSHKRKLKIAGWDNDYLLSLLI
jgi:predicted transposase YbfD/YdcC